MFMTRTQAKTGYSDILSDAKKAGQVEPVMAVLGRKDLFFLLTVLLNRVDVDSDWLYERCLEVQENPDSMLDLWAREHYKSTIITFAKTIQDVLDSHSKKKVGIKTVSDSFYWEKEITVGIFSHTRPIAKAFLSQIMQEFEGNELLKQLYPDVLYKDPRREAPSWSLDAGITVKRTSNPKEATISAYGLVDGQPTSKHFDILNYDDIVTRESVTTSEMIDKVTEAFSLSLNLGATGGVKRIIGTRYAVHDTYATIIKRGMVTVRLRPATDDGKPEGNPVFLTRELLAEKRRDMGPYIFGSQMLQNPKADDQQGFDADWLQYWDVKSFTGMNIYMLVDPASSKKKGRDYTAILIVGLAEDHNYYLIDGIRDRMNLTERCSNVFKFHRKYRPLAVGYEKYAQQADQEHIESVMDTENYRFQITPLGGAVSKVDRIRRLVPAIEQRRFFFPRRLVFTDQEGKGQDLTKIISDEFIEFPFAKYDDCSDCLARIVDLDLGAKFPEIEVFTGAEPIRAETGFDVYA